MINAAVEGESDRGLAHAVIRASGHEVGRIIAKGGKSKLDPLILKYCSAARIQPWVVFRDSDTECPMQLHEQLTSGITPPKTFQLRLARPMSEAWLLADRDGFAKYFGVRAAAIPHEPETLNHAKNTVLQLCSQSRIRTIRQDMVASGNKTGPLYVHRINEFATTRWNVSRAAERCDSLARALQRIRDMPGMP